MIRIINNKNEFIIIDKNLIHFKGEIFGDKIELKTRIYYENCYCFNKLKEKLINFFKSNESEMYIEACFDLPTNRPTNPAYTLLVYKITKNKFGLIIHNSFHPAIPKGNYMLFEMKFNIRNVEIYEKIKL